MGLYLKAFLQFGVLFGIAMGLMNGFEHALKSGIFFGLFMSLFLVTYHKYKTKNMAVEGDVSPQQTKTIRLNMSISDAYDRCHDVLAEVGAKTIFENKNLGKIKARTSPSWESFGESILFQLTVENTGQICVQVSSSPRLKTTILDYGKAYQTVKRISSLLAKPIPA